MDGAERKKPEVFRVLGRGVRTLPCLLPDDEKAERGEKIGVLDQEMEELEAEIQSHKDIVKGLNLQLETKTVEMREHAKAIRVGADLPVNIRTEISPDATTIQVIREDTGEVIEERPSTPEERQGKLFNEDVAAKVQAAIQGGKKDDGELDLSPLSPEELAKQEAEAEEYLKKNASKKKRKKSDEDDEPEDEE